ncbi:unnamed protein product [Urochloa humidicola]
MGSTFPTFPHHGRRPEPLLRGCPPSPAMAGARSSFSATGARRSSFAAPRSSTVTVAARWRKPRLPAASHAAASELLQAAPAGGLTRCRHGSASVGTARPLHSRA